MNNQNQKPVIYQIFPRIFTNTESNCIPDGTLEENGSGHLEDYTPTLLGAIRNLGATHIWFTGIIEHATKEAFPSAGIPADNPNIVKGIAGSPYAIKDYYDVDPALTKDPRDRMSEFEKLVARAHEADLGVIIDFVPNHTARRYHSDVAPKGVHDFGADDNINMCFDPNNNYYYITNQQFAPSFSLSAEGDTTYVEFPAKATGNDCFTAFCSKFDWYETVKLNYGHDYGNNSDHFEPIPDTWFKMRDILLFWASKGIDGFRCDMVFMVPMPFWHWVIPIVKAKHPDIKFIGEIYDVGLYRPFLDYCHFDYLYDKVNLYDTLVGIERYNVSAAKITGCWQTVDGIGDKMLNFIENHDEVRFASREFADDATRAIPHMAVSALMSKGAVMIYYGQELGEPAHDNEGYAGDNNRSTIFDFWSYDTMRRWYNHGRCDGALLHTQEKWLRSFYSRLLNLCNSNAAIREGGFYDLMYVNLQNPRFNPHNNFAFLRHTEDEIILVAVNFGREATSMSINIPDHAFDFVGIPDNIPARDELLWGRKVAATLKRGESLRINLEASDAIAIRFVKTTTGDTETSGNGKPSDAAPAKVDSKERTAAKNKISSKLRKSQK